MFSDDWWGEWFWVRTTRMVSSTWWIKWGCSLYYDMVWSFIVRVGLYLLLCCWNVWITLQIVVFTSWWIDVKMNWHVNNVWMYVKCVNVWLIVWIVIHVVNDWLWSEWGCNLCYVVVVFMWSFIVKVGLYSLFCCCMIMYNQSMIVLHCSMICILCCLCCERGMLVSS